MVVSGSPLIVIGHRNPDTDSIVSALVYAGFKRKMGQSAKAARAGSLNKESKFVLSYFNQRPPSLVKSVAKKRVILVDHGDSSQAVSGLDKAEILEIIDHHRIGDVRTVKPILYRAEPLGSTSTILAKLFKEKEVKMSRVQAGLLLAGIISDTLFFRSPTTTKEDIEISKTLSRISKIKPEIFAKKMFEAKSDLRGVSVKDIISKDFKKFEFGGIKFGISVFETTNPEKVKPLETKIFKALNGFKKERKQRFIFFLLIDILKQCSFLYLMGEEEKEIAKKAFLLKIDGQIVFLPGVVSRKKQVLPPLAKVIKSLKA